MQRRITHASVAPCSPSADGREVQHGDLVVIRCDDYSPPLYLRCSSERRLSWQRERDVDRHGKCVFVTFGSRGPISRVASAEARLASTSGAFAKISGAVVIAPSSNARPQRLQSKKPARQQDQLSRAVVIVPMVIIITIAYDRAGRNGISSGTSTGRP